MRSILHIILLAGLGIWLPVSGWAAPAAPRHYALIVGIGDYAAYPRLAYATNDAVGMARLASRRGFDEVILLLNAAASRAQIIATVDGLRRRLQADDMLTFFYAGHAVRLADGQGGYRGFLVPHDCHQGREREEGLPMSAMADMLADLPNRYFSLVIDACNGGMLADAVSRRMAAPGAVSNRIVAVVASSGEGELAFEAKGHGVFTGELLNALATTVHDPVLGRKPDAKLMQDLQQFVVDETGGWQQPRVEQYGGGAQSISLRGF